MLLVLKNFYSIALLLLNMNSLLLHDFHMSYGESTISSNEFKGKITFYKDDFFKALKNFNEKNIANFSNNDFDELKKNYLIKHFQVIINNKDKLKLNITGNDEDASSIWFSFLFKATEEIHSIKIIHSALFNEFSDQLNILNITTPNGEESKIFKESHPEFEINL